MLCCICLGQYRLLGKRSLSLCVLPLVNSENGIIIIIIIIIISLFNFVGMKEKFTPSFTLCLTIIIANLLINVHKACSYIIVATDFSLERRSHYVMLW